MSRKRKTLGCELCGKGRRIKSRGGVFLCDRCAQAERNRAYDTPVDFLLIADTQHEDEIDAALDEEMRAGR